MFVFVSNKSINILDNPYFVVKPYVLDDQKNFLFREPKEGEVKLIQCPENEKYKYLKANARYFGNTVCFEDPTKMEIKSNWWHKNFKNYVISIE